MALNPRTVTSRYAVQGQLLPSEIMEAKAQGYQSIINHRPDGEEPMQPSSEALEHAAKAAGLAYLHLPISGPISAAQKQAMQEALATMPQPVLAFCRSGARSTRAWAHAMQTALPETELFALAAQAGCDIYALQAELEQQKANPHE